MHFTLRQFRVFEAVADHLSFTQAAKTLHLSQPAVSMQVKAIEEQVGLPLFEQLGKQIYLTEAGHEIHHYSRAIRQLLDEAEDVINGLKGAHQGRLTISVASTANYFVPTLLGVFHERFPDITVSLDVTNRETLLKQLSENVVDLVVMGQPPEDADLEAGIFMENPLVIVAPPNHPLAKQKNIPFARLEDEVFLTRERGSGTRSAIERFFEQHGVQLNTGMEIGVMNIVFLRAGYKALFLDYSEESFTFGAGLRYDVVGTNLKFDFGWADFGRLKNVQFISLAIGY